MKGLVRNLYICVDFSEGEDDDILLVGQRNFDGTMKIVNTFLNEDAHEMYERLVTVRKERRSK